MYCGFNGRTRAVLFSCLTASLLLFGFISWPWLCAAWLWQRSTIAFPLVSPANYTETSVPPILHQTWRDRHTIPSSWQQASNSCRSLHPNYEYRFWTDVEARRLVEKEFPDLLVTFDAYPYDIQRADVIRLVVLYVYGGIYLDMDIICLKELDPLRTYQLVLPKTMPVGLSNDFIVAQPRHPFLLQLLSDLPRSNRNYLTK
jgi:mannosyltransferase OCH1-like enzyme